MGTKRKAVISMETNDGLLEDMVDYSADPWHGLHAFTPPKILAILSPGAVQNALENLPAGLEARVSDTPSPAKEGLLGIFAARPLNPAIGGTPFTLFPANQLSQNAEALYGDLPQSELQYPPSEEALNRGGNPLAAQTTSITEQVQV